MDAGWSTWGRERKAKRQSVLMKYILVPDQLCYWLWWSMPTLRNTYCLTSANWRQSYYFVCSFFSRHHKQRPWEVQSDQWEDATYNQQLWNILKAHMIARFIASRLTSEFHSTWSTGMKVWLNLGSKRSLQVHLERPHEQQAAVVCSMRPGPQIWSSRRVSAVTQNIDTRWPARPNVYLSWCLSIWINEQKRATKLCVSIWRKSNHWQCWNWWNMPRRPDIWILCNQNIRPFGKHWDWSKSLP